MKLLFEKILNKILLEQEQSEPAAFSTAQQKFLGNFAKKGSESLGIIYSTSPEGIEEFMLRSGDALNLNFDVLKQLMDVNIVSIEPIGSLRDPLYTIQLNIPLTNVEKFAALSGEKADGSEETDDMNLDSGTSGGGFTGGGMTTADLDTGAAGGEPDVDVDTETGAGEEAEIETDVEEEPEIPAGGPEESFNKNGTLIVENKKYQIYNYRSILEQSAITLRELISENPKKYKVYSGKSRVLKRLPTGYIYYLEKIIEVIAKRLQTDLEKEHLVADLLDNLSHNFGLTPNQVLRSYIFYKNQNKLRNLTKK